jgi:hypothetical protein
MIKGIEDIINNAVKELKRTSKRVILLAVIGLGLYAGTASTSPGFDGQVWRGSYGTGADSTVVTMYNPHNTDSATTRVGRGGASGYWIKGTTWNNIVLGDSVRIKVVDTNGDSARTYKIVTSISGNNRTFDLFPAGHSILVKRVTDSVDSTNAKCYVKGKQDTLSGRFDINNFCWDISFNAANFPIRSRPVNGDTVVIEAREDGYYGSTYGIYGRKQFGDVDSLNDFNMASGVYEEIDKHDRFVGDLRITPNPFTSFATLPGHEGERFSLYDISGRRVGTYRGDRVGVGLAPGVYFLRSSDSQDKPLRIVKVR